MNRRASFLTLTAMAGLPAQLAFGFTAEQAEAGLATYTQACAACHGADHRPLPPAPLGGEYLIANWRTRNTNFLRAQRPTTMPPESPGSLGEDGYLTVMAFILQRNGNAAGEDRLLAASGESISAGSGGGAGGAPAPFRLAQGSGRHRRDHGRAGQRAAHAAGPRGVRL